MYKPITDVPTEPSTYLTMRFLAKLEMGGDAGSSLYFQPIRIKVPLKNPIESNLTLNSPTRTAHALPTPNELSEEGSHGSINIGISNYIGPYLSSFFNYIIFHLVQTKRPFWGLCFFIFMHHFLRRSFSFCCLPHIRPYLVVLGLLF